MRVEIDGEIVLEVEASAEVSKEENASALIVTIRVKDGAGWKEINITSALDDNQKALLLVGIEDKYRKSLKDVANFGRGEAV